jgi:hypothetical protein
VHPQNLYNILAAAGCEIVPVVPRGAETFNGGVEGRNAAAMTALGLLT